MSKNNNITLNIKHTELINEMRSEEQTIPIIEEEIHILTEANNELKKDTNYMYNKTYCNNSERIKNLEVSLARIKALKLDYYIKNASIIFEYNEMDKAIDFTKNTYNNNCFKTKSNNDGQNIIMNKNISKNINSNITMNGNITMNANINANINTTINNKSKAELLKLYLANNNLDNYVGPPQENQNIFCETCKINRELNDHEAKLICRKCGDSIQILLESDKPISKDYPNETRHYEYKKFNHFCYWLAKIQGKESCDIPNEVIVTISSAIDKDKIDKKLLDESMIKDYLKRYKNIGYDKYYNHTIYILMKITGNTPITLSLEEEKEYKMMFIIIQELWLLYKPEDRSNFGSYSYIIFKFAQLRKDKHIMKKMKLLKCKEKLHELDVIWKAICKHLGGAEKGWKFIQTY